MQFDSEGLIFDKTISSLYMPSHPQHTYKDKGGTLCTSFIMLPKYPQIQVNKALMWRTIFIPVA